MKYESPCTLAKQCYIWSQDKANMRTTINNVTRQEVPDTKNKRIT